MLPPRRLWQPVESVRNDIFRGLLQDVTLGGVGLSQLPLDYPLLSDDHDTQAAQALNQRGSSRCRARTTLGVQAVERLPLQFPAHLTLHQRQHHQRPDQDAQQAPDPLGVLQEHRRHRQRTLQVMEPTLDLALLLVRPQHLRQPVVLARQVGLQDIDALQILPTLQRLGVEPPVEPEVTRLVLTEPVVEQCPLAILPLGRLQTADDRLGCLQAVPAQVPLHRLELRPDLGRVPLARAGLLPGLGLAPDEDQPVVEPDRLPIDRPLQVLGDFDRLVLVPLLGRKLGLALGEVVDLVQLVPQLQVAVLELGGEGTATEELPLAGGDRQEVGRSVELGVGDVEQLALGQSAAQELEVLQVGVDLPGVAIERQVPDRHAAVAGDVEAELDLLDVLAAAL